MNIEQQEKLKYDKCWLQVYPRGKWDTPLIAEFDEAIRLVPKSSIIDFGAGSGWVCEHYKQRGLKPIAIDISEYSLDEHLKASIDFHVCTLWNIPAHVKGDYGFCQDVMEHIPPEKVDNVLENIRKSVRKEVAFMISREPDRAGSKIKEVLHLTIRSHDWWIDQLRQHWGSILFEKKGLSHSRFVVAP